MTGPDAKTAEPKVRDQAATGSPLIELDSVRVEHGGGVVALDGVSLRVHVGERVGIVGPSGAGKSTLLSLCNGMVLPTTGCVRFHGEPVSDDDRWRRTSGSLVAFIPQQLHLVDRLRVVHNVNSGRLGDWSTPRALWSLVRPLELDQVTDLLARVGLSEKVFVRTDRLSGGERQRVAVARALRQKPDLLLADEPTASLDPRTSLEVMTLIARLVAEDAMTLLVSQHDVQLAKSTCDRLVGLRRGRVVFDQPSASVTSDALARLYGLASAP